MATDGTTQPPEPQANSLAEWMTKAAGLIGLTHVGHRAMMLDKIQKQNAVVLDTVKGMQRGAAPGKMTPATAEDDMGVSVIGEAHYHVEHKNSGVGKALLAAAAAAAFGAAGLAAAQTLLNRLPGDPPAPPPAMVDTDTDTDTLDVVELGR